MGDFIDFALEHIRPLIPPPLYSIVYAFFSQSITLVSSLSALLLTNPSQWNVQSVLPPLITLLTAYLVFLSLYRTTTWMIRASFWFIKWGVIVGTLMAGIAWVISTTNSVNSASRDGSRSQRARSPPKPWDSFNRHRQWRQQEQNGDALEIVESITVAAKQALKDSQWWEAAKTVVDGLELDQRTPGGKRTTSTKGKSSRPR